MLIEFAGPPGSGKSTLTKNLVRRLRVLGVSAYTEDQAVTEYNSRSKIRKFVSPFFNETEQVSLLGKYFSLRSPWYLYQFKLNHPDFWRVIQESYHRRPINENHQDLIRNYFKRTMIYYQFIVDHGNQDEVILFDEGFAHRITHFVSEREVPDWIQIEKYLKFIPKSNSLVYLDVPPSICVERVQKRGLRGRLANLNGEELNSFISKSSQALDFGTSFLADQGVNIISLDAAADSEQVMDNLESRIVELIDSSFASVVRE